jgi:hypothetical protein
MANKGDDPVAAGTSGRGAGKQPPVVTHITPLVARMFWFFVGPMVAILTLLGILFQGSGWLTVLDAVYLTAVVLMVGSRWVEQRSGEAATATGEPSTWAHFRRYATVLVPVALCAWLAANVVGNHIFDGIGS